MIYNNITLDINNTIPQIINDSLYTYGNVIDGIQFSTDAILTRIIIINIITILLIFTWIYKKEVIFRILAHITFFISSLLTIFIKIIRINEINNTTIFYTVLLMVNIFVLIIVGGLELTRYIIKKKILEKYL